LTARNVYLTTTTTTTNIPYGEENNIIRYYGIGENINKKATIT
jgi:hypothetical protein